MRTRARYTLVRRLARGGMGEVHLAVASGLGGARKLVVVKQVLEGLADDPEFREMFLNEARLAATLDHPHIVRVYDVCEIDGRPSIVMEYVHGESLGSLLHLAASRDDVLPLADALTIVDAVAGALVHAHEATAIDGRPLGIVHRDVAPNNILVGYAGEVKLIDFGVARALGVTRITRGSMVKGKAAYMAPEQYAGGEVDGRTDVFSLGVVLYEATTMRRAFKADSEIATINRIVSGDLVRPTEVRPDYPRVLEDVVLGAVAIDPADRFPTAQAFREALADAARELGLAISAQHVRGTLVRLAGEKPPPRVDLATIGMLRARRWGVRRAPVLAFAAGVAATGIAAITIGRGNTAVEPTTSVVDATSRCGDGTVDADELCDDGNARDGDGCNRDCRPSGSVLWERTFQGDDPGRTRDDRGYRIAIDANDEIVVVGEAAVRDAGQNVFVRKYGADGEVRWTRQPGKAGDDEAWAVQTLDDGGVVVGGYVFDDETGRDFWLAGFDADGRERWQYQRDAAEIAGRDLDPKRRSDDEIRGLVMTGPGRIVVVGKSFVDGAEDRFAAHGTVDASGLRLTPWDLASSEQPGGWDAVADVVRTDEGIVLTGSRTRFARDGAKSLWVGWFDANGGLLRELAIEPPGWPTPAGGEGNQLWASNGTIFVAALVGGWGVEANAYYAALDGDAHLSWSREYDGAAKLRDFAHGITVDREGNVIVVGEANGAPDRTGTGPDANAQVWITKLAPDLTELWTELYNGPENERDVAFDVATDSTNHIVVVGYQSVAGNGYDLWVRKYRP